MAWVRGPIRTLVMVICALCAWQARAALVPSTDGTTVFDTVNNVSWLADFNLPATNQFGIALCNGAIDTKLCINASGSMTYQAALSWIAAMNAANYRGHNNWQLPTTWLVDPGCSFIGPQANGFGWGCSGSALGSLYYNALGLKSPNTAVPIPVNTAGPFTNFQPYLYWTQSINSQNGTGFSTFSFNSGFLGSNTNPNYLYVLPMIPGKLAGTPAATGTGLQVNPGGQTVYDPVANVTWLANANIAATNTFGLAACTKQGSPNPCVNADGAMNSDSAAQFIANMNSFNGSGYLGQANWQMPTAAADCTGYGCSSAGNPMGELFYGQFGLKQGASVVATPSLVVGPLSNIQPYLYWSCQGATIAGPCSSAGPASGFEWSFSPGNGFQGTDILQNDLYVTAYFPGPSTPASVNYEGLWWRAPAGFESGWGINLTHQGDIIFATWFTYDIDGTGMWLVMTAPKTSADTYSGALLRTTGPAFSAVPFDPSKVVATQVGTGTLTFTDQDNGSFAYTVNGVAQTKALTREIFSSPVPTCAEGATAGSVPNYQDLWWRSPAASESGWGINLTHQGDTIFATWFTYGADGKGLWIVMTAGKTAPNTYGGKLYRTNGPAFNSVPFNPASIVASEVGSATLTFSDASNGVFAYTLNGVTQSKPITREIFQSPATVCK